MGLDAGVGRLMFWDPSSIVGSPSYHDGVGRFIFWDPSCVVDSPFIMINVMSLFHSQKSNKVGGKKFLRLQCVAMEEQAKPKAKWEEESKMLKQSDVSSVEQKC